MREGQERGWAGVSGYTAVPSKFQEDQEGDLEPKSCIRGVLRLGGMTVTKKNAVLREASQFPHLQVNLKKFAPKNDSFTSTSPIRDSGRTKFGGWILHCCAWNQLGSFADFLSLMNI